MSPPSLCPINDSSLHNSTGSWVQICAMEVLLPKQKYKTLRYFKIISIEKLLSGLALSGDAQVPGGIFADLKKANILKEDFFFRENDVMYRWVSWDNWTYHATFKGLQTLQAKIIDTIFCVLRIL